MTADPPRSTLLIVLCALVACACGGPASSGAASTESGVDTVASRAADGSIDPLPGEIDDDWTMLRTTLSRDALDELSGGGLLEAPAGPVPDPDTHFPVEGPQGGALFVLGEGLGFYEFSHNEHWGVSALHLYDARMRPRAFDEPPVLNVHCDGESFTLEPGRESFEDEVEDGGWHFEDDALLGYPDTGRFRFVVDGRTYTPAFAHIHVGHGHAHPSEHASGPHLHGLGPHRGTIVTLGAHHAHLEVVHEPHRGILGLYLYDAAMEPREMDAAPVLNIVSDDEPHQLTAGEVDWVGEEDGGWHFEDDALLGETGPARLRLVVDGKTYTPPFTYDRHGEEPGHAHAADGERGTGH